MDKACSALLPTLLLFTVVVAGALASIPLIAFGKILFTPITFMYHGMPVHYGCIHGIII